MPSTTLIKNPSLDTTLEVMRTKANEAKKTLRPFVESIVKHVESGSYNDEISAIYGWVRVNIAYRKDPHDVEYVRAPARLVVDVRVEHCAGFVHVYHERVESRKDV